MAGKPSKHDNAFYDNMRDARSKLRKSIRQTNAKDRETKLKKSQIVKIIPNPFTHW